MKLTKKHYLIIAVIAIAGIAAYFLFFAKSKKLVDNVNKDGLAKIISIYNWHQTDENGNKNVKLQDIYWDVATNHGLLTATEIEYLKTNNITINQIKKAV